MRILALLQCLLHLVFVRGATIRTRQAASPYHLDVPATSMARARELLDSSALSCVTYDASSGVGRLSASADDLFDPRELQQVRQSTGNMQCKTPRTTSFAIMVPTYLKHQNLYGSLVTSIAENIVDQEFTLVSVFSSLEEANTITRDCENCTSTPLRLMRPLIFNHFYTYPDNNFVARVNYQAAKKFWALSHVKHETVLMLDSDYVIVRPINLARELAVYGRVLYMHPNNWRDQWTLQDKSNNRILGANITEGVPFEMPWIYNTSHIPGLLSYLNRMYGSGQPEDYILWLFEKTDFHVFEPLLYRYWVMSREPGYFSRRLYTEKIWFEENSTEQERLSLDPPPVAILVKEHKERPCELCWLGAHADWRGFPPKPIRKDKLK